MRILLAGGQGQVGSAIASIGKEQGLDLVALGRSELDITDETSIAAAFEKYKPGMLINAGAYTAVDKAEIESELAYEINETATALLADACAKVKIPMIHISTDYVFDGSKEGFYTEADTVNPLAVYGKSKEAGERALRERQERHIILRTSWVFGVQGGNFVKTIVRLAGERNELQVVSDQYGGPTSANEIAKTLLKIAKKYQEGEKIHWGTYHFCNRPYVSWYEFARVIIDISTEVGLINSPVNVKAVKSKDFPTLVDRPKNSKLDTNKIIEEFGLESKSWHEDLLECLRNIKNK